MMFELKKNLKKFYNNSVNKPSVTICHTIKGGALNLQKTTRIIYKNILRKEIQDLKV